MGKRARLSCKVIYTCSKEQFRFNGTRFHYVANHSWTLSWRELVGIFSAVAVLIKVLYIDSLNIESLLLQIGLHFLDVHE